MTPRWVAVVLAGSALLSACSGSGGDSGRRPSLSRAGPLVHDGPRHTASVWAAGDGADGGPQAKAVTRVVKHAHPDLFLYLGDVYPEGDADGFAHGYAPTFGALARITAPTPGNHDESVARDGYVPYWTKLRRARPPRYYSFRAGGWQILSLNSEIGTGRRSSQLRWLRRRLARPGNCRLAFWHRPRFSAGSVHGDSRRVNPLWRTLQGHARLVLNGHEHDMQRMRPRHGLVELIDGAGGHGLYGLRRRYRGLAFGNGHSYGAIRITLRPGLAGVAFVDIRGRTLDRTAVRCRALGS